ASWSPTSSWPLASGRYPAKQDPLSCARLRVMSPFRLQDIPGFTAEGDVIGVNEAIREGREPILVTAFPWPVPATLPTGNGPERVGISDELLPIRPGVAILRPPSLLVGIDPRPGASPLTVEDMVIESLAQAGLSRSAVAAITTLDKRDGGPLHSLGHPVR